MDAAEVDCARRLSCHFLRGAERENIRESTREGLDTASRKGKHGGRPPVITDDMLHIVLRRRANGECVEQIQPDLIIPTGKRKGRNPSVAGTYRALAEHAEREAYPEAAEKAPADFAAASVSARCAGAEVIVGGPPRGMKLMNQEKLSRPLRYRIDWAEPAA
ncbi:hypothetical protein [Kitasatospora sp. NPDC057541]|uniref:hypothetical protein n=1 Tax=unclassified Kitasatospora TaxID=2633591 RepID=UPI003684CFB1